MDAMDSPAFFIALFVHVTSLILAFGAVMVTDHFGLRWMRGRIEFSRLLKLAGVTEKMIWTGWAGMVASGIPMVFMKGEIDRLMVIKLFLVALAGLNGYALHRIRKSNERYAGADSVPSLPIYRLGLALLVSQTAWWGAFIIGFLHRHVWSIIEWPPVPWVWIAVFCAVLVGLIVVGEVVFRAKPSRIRVEEHGDAQRVETGPGPTLDPLGKGA
jgi:hypothetical protein